MTLMLLPNPVFKEFEISPGWNSIYLDNGVSSIYYYQYYGKGEFFYNPVDEEEW